MNRTVMETFLEDRLDDETLEEILESYDLLPIDVLMNLFDQGLVREDYPPELESEDYG